MPEKRDYYQVLEVPRDASSEDLRRAYRRLAKQFHPDVNKEPGSEESFKEINEAYAVLSDDERRAAYDRFGHAGVQGMPADFGINPFDIFEEFFGFGMGGGRRSRRSPRRGADLRYDQSLSFEESVFGAEKELAFARQDTCPACSGSGAEPGTSPVRCKACNGAGEVRQVRQTFLGSMVNVSTCPTCGGSGETVATPCRGCRGTGQQRAEIKRVVPVPAGVDDGTQIRLGGEGEPGINGGPRGDLYLVLHVKPHRYFRRRDDDILLDVSINVAQAALGAKISVPTVDGDEPLSVPAGTQAGRVLRLKGKGVPHVRRTGRGDQLVVLSVEVPRTLTKDQRELFEKLGGTLSSDARPQEKGFLDSLKELFGGSAD
jgi:molecular chaperone DnaJ